VSTNTDAESPFCFIIISIFCDCTENAVVSNKTAIAVKSFDVFMIPVFD
jgi:hypothetical protein